MSALPERPLSLVVGALGGEGGGVLTTWIVRAAETSGFPTQSTSIPGVAQRTGATTYYIEIYPVRREELGGRRPVMGLYPAPGNMDVVITSELMEAGRMLESGMVTPDRTTLIASTHRVYSIFEKSAMGDGLFRSDKLGDAARQLSRRAVLFDMARLAEEKGTVLNAVVLGVVAGCGQLPIPAETFAAAIRESGVAVDSNLRGFEAGLAYVRGELDPPAAAAAKKARPARPSAEGLLSEVEAAYPAEARPVVAEGVKRLVDYQDAAYARLYLDRLAGILDIDRRRGGDRSGWKLVVETGRHLALAMSYEDIIRVADLKSRRSRIERVRADAMAKPGEPVRITEFLKPGFDELASVMPPWLGGRVMGWARGNAWARSFNFAMRVRADTVWGFARLWALARLRFWRPRSYRYAEEQRLIESWLGTVAEAAQRHYGLAVGIAELANLRKGYSDTHRRGAANFARVMAEIAVPCARADRDPAWGAEAVARAREAALADPEGETLDRTLAELAAGAAPAAAAE